MATASKVMYIIGIVFNVLAIIGMILLALFGLFINTNAEELVAQVGEFTEEFPLPEGIELTTELVSLIGMGLIIGSAVAFVLSIAVFCLALWASKSISNGKRECAPHIVMIVVGVLSTYIFYLLGGIFGLISESKE